MRILFKLLCYNCETSLNIQMTQLQGTESIYPIILIEYIFIWALHIFKEQVILFKNSTLLQINVEHR